MPAPTGGTITTDGDYTVHTFTSSGTFTVYNSGNVDYLVVAGGGGGGGSNSSTRSAGGGGAGEYAYGTSFAVTAQAYSITVGTGGAGGGTSDPGTNGGNSVFSTITCLGGGGGGVGGGGTGLDGGSGGGNGRNNTGAAGQAIGSYSGNDGGAGDAGFGGGDGGGGGGGAGTVGEAGTQGSGGDGGDGNANSITGTSVTYAGGGGGGCNSGGTGGAAGIGGGGAGGSSGSGSNGTDGLGGGGGGAGGTAIGGDGGDGVVIIRYLTADFPDGPIVFDTATNRTTVNPATSISYSHTCSGTNRVLVVQVRTEGSSEVITGVTYNSVSMTQAVKRQDTSNNRWQYLYVLENPATGSNTVLVSFSSSIAAASSSASYTGAKQSGQPDSSNSIFETNQSGNRTVTVTTSADNCWLVSSTYSQDANPTAVVNGVARSETSAFRDGIADSNGPKTPAGAHTIGYTWGSADDHIIVALALAPFSESTRRIFIIG